MTSTSLGRVHIIEGTPPALPGKCSMCGTTQGTFIDIGFELDYYGVVYFCVENCFVEIANAFGYHSPRQWRMVMNAYEELRTKFNDLVDENEKMKNVIESYDSLTLNGRHAIVSELDVDEESEQVNPESTEREEGSSEQIDESRLSDVQCDDSLDEFLKSI
jgi:hypothetical protein